MKQQIGFIGAGNMAQAIIGGIIRAGLVEARQIHVSNPSSGKLEMLSAQYGVQVTNDNRALVREAEDYLFLCVKPHVLPQVIAEIRDLVTEKTTVISVAAGKQLAEMEKLFAKPVRLVRIMPNTPALVGEGCSAICANAEAEKPEHKDVLKDVQAMCESFGTAYLLPEHLIGVAGQVAGASPAWIFMVMEALADGAVAEGMPRDLAYRFAAAGVAGAGKLALQTGKHPGELKDMVTSPGGSTIQGVRALEAHGVRSAFTEAVIAACEKAKQL